MPLLASAARLQLADGTTPPLTLDNPQLLDTCSACADNYVHVMLAPRTCDAFLYIGIHAVSPENVRSSLLVVPPRRHGFQCALDR